MPRNYSAPRRSLPKNSDRVTNAFVKDQIDRALRAILTAHGVRSAAGRIGEPQGGDGAQENPAEARLVAAIAGESLFEGCSDAQLRLILINYAGGAGHVDVTRKSATGHAVVIARRPRYLGYTALARLAGLRSAHEARQLLRDVLVRVARNLERGR